MLRYAIVAASKYVKYTLFCNDYYTMPQILPAFLGNRFVRLFRKTGRNAKKYNEIGFMKRERERLRTEKRWLEGNFQIIEKKVKTCSSSFQSRILNNG